MGVTGKKIPVLSMPRSSTVHLSFRPPAPVSAAGRPSVLDEIKKKGIILHNWREDRVSRKLIDDLIVLDAEDPEERIVQLNSNTAQDGSLQVLEKLRFNARWAYAQALEQRLLAAVITHSQERMQFQDAIANFSATASPYGCNWILAEKFLQDKAGLSDPQETPAAAVLYPWLESIWSEEQREAVKGRM
jgi:hypothetical protein